MWNGQATLENRQNLRKLNTELAYDLVTPL